MFTRVQKNVFLDGIALLGVDNLDVSRTTFYSPKTRLVGNASFWRDRFSWKFAEEAFIYINQFLVQMHGRTNGWIGVGLSPNGGMIGADIFIGWVKNGEAFITVSVFMKNPFISYKEAYFIGSSWSRIQWIASD